MSEQTRMLIIRSLTAETVFVRHLLPQGTAGITLKDGQILAPGEDELARSVATFGAAAKPGDRAQISAVRLKENKIIVEINGGAKKKTKWYQHISVSGVGGTTQAPEDTSSNPHGALITLEFATPFVPEMTGDQVRQLLAPVLDFSARSAAEAYLESVSPKVKQAIQNHQVLVGMNREMVEYAKGRPNKKIREKDEAGKEYEEWLYGTPPQDVEFVRFQGDEVVRLEIMQVDGQKIVRTEREVEAKPAVAEKEPSVQPAAPAKPPSLRRPGEEPDGTSE
jgi:hypothetical protein